MNEEFVLGSTGKAAHEDEEVRVDPKKDLITNWQVELDTYYRVMQQLGAMDPSEVMLRLSSWSARASEIRSQLVRVDSRRTTAFRTREVDPFLEECDRQFKIHSRLQSLRELEWKMQGGPFA